MPRQRPFFHLVIPALCASLRACDAFSPDCNSGIYPAVRVEVVDARTGAPQPRPGA